MTNIKTNNKTGSICTLKIDVITFSLLWDNYVTGSPYLDKSGNIPKGYENQCAIRMSATFHKIGIKMLSYKGVDKILLGGLPTSVRAQALGKWLEKQPFCGLPQKPENITGANWESIIKGRTGIIMFDSYWRRAGESAANATGGHIDLWNGSRLTVSGLADAFATYGRMLGVNSLFPGTDYGYSDLGGSKNILFWEVK